MTIRTILATMHADVEPAPQLGAALQLARRLGATIEALHARPTCLGEEVGKLGAVAGSHGTWPFG